MELKSYLKNVFSKFKNEDEFVDFKTFTSGHINDTYLIITNKKSNYILQKINGNIFENAIEVIENKCKVTRFLESKNIQSIQFFKTKNQKNYFKDLSGNFWSLSLYIDNSKTYLETLSKKMAFEAGKVTGQFLRETKESEENLIEVLPNFHSMTFRLQQFNQAILNGNEVRKKEAKKWIDFVFSLKDEMLEIDNAIKQKEILLRVTHNDTKISNILFDSNQNALCLIDLDTVMLGAIHYDFGDALRTICNTVKEDDIDEEKVQFNITYFKEYTSGFMKGIEKSISKNELKYLHLSPKIMTFIMGVRFLTDFLNNDIYYKTNYKNHNLERAKNQFTLVTKIKKNQEEIKRIISKYL